jgi:hypothetical protein
MISKRSVCMKSLSFSLYFSHFMALNKSFLNALNGRREKYCSVPLQFSCCRLTGIKLHISKSDDEPSEHFGSSFRYGGNGGGGMSKSGGATNPHSISQSNLKSMSNFFHITLCYNFSQ